MVLRCFLLQVQVKLAISAVVKTQKMHTFALEIMPKTENVSINYEVAQLLTDQVVSKLVIKEPVAG